MFKICNKLANFLHLIHKQFCALYLPPPTPKKKHVFGLASQFCTFHSSLLESVTKPLVLRCSVVETYEVLHVDGVWSVDWKTISKSKNCPQIEDPSRSKYLIHRLKNYLQTEIKEPFALGELSADWKIIPCIGTLKNELQIKELSTD